MRFLVVICVITALAAPSLGQSSLSTAPETVSTEANPAAPETQSEDKANADAAPAPAENPPIEAESSDANNQAPETIPNIAKPLVDPTPAPGEEPIEVELPHKTRPFYDFLHTIYDRLPFHLSDLHWPSLWPFRRSYPGRSRFSPRARYPDRYLDRYPEREPGAFIVRESEPDYY